MPTTAPSPASPPSAPRVPVRTILATIGLVLLSGLTLVVVMKMAKLITWLVVAGFFAVVLAPALTFLEKRAHLRRGLAALVVFVLGVGLFAAMIYAFVRPIVDQGNQFVDNFPRYVAEAKAGRGPVGHLVKKYKVDTYLEKNQDRLRKALKGAGKPALAVAQSVANTVAALVTILVLTFLMLLEGPKMLRSGLGILSPPTAERVRKVADDSARAVTGYVAGNLLISAIAAALVYFSLLVLGVPFRGVLALWVAFADLIPLVGATLGAIPTVLVALLHNTTSGFVMIGVFVAYQQFENHVLQVTIMARTVRLNPLTVLVSVLAGVELFGILGALLAIPAAGIIQVVVRDVYDHRRGGFKAEPTIGAEQIPVSQILAQERTEEAAPVEAGVTDGQAGATEVADEQEAGAAGAAEAAHERATDDAASGDGRDGDGRDGDGREGHGRPPAGEPGPSVGVAPPAAPAPAAETEVRQ